MLNHFNRHRFQSLNLSKHNIADMILHDWLKFLGLVTEVIFKFRGA